MKFKRIILLITAMIMAFQIAMPISFASLEESKIDSSVGLLEALDIVDEDTLMNDEEVTRGMLAKEVYKLLNMESTGYSEIFGDVQKDTPYAEYITGLAQMGIISKGDMYYPEQPATYEQAVKMIVCVLGYDKAIVGGEWPGNYLKKASEIGLTQSINAGAGNILTGRMLISLLYNSLGCKLLLYDLDGEFKTDVDKTLLTENFDVRKVKGIVIGTENAYLSVTGHADKGSAIVGDESYSDADGLLTPFLGYEVYAYYKESDDEKKIIYASETTRNKKTVVSAKDIEKDRINDLSRFAWRENSSSVKTMTIDDNADVIYNGRSFPAFSTATITPSSGKVELLDNNGDGRADVIFVWESKTYVFANIDLANELITDKYGKYLDYSKYENVEFFDMYGKPTTADIMSAWNVLSVYESKDGDYCRISVYDDPVIGTVDRIFTDDGKTWIVVDDEEYALSEAFEEAVEKGNSNAHAVTLGQTGIYYLNADEEVGASLIEDDWSSRYAFLISASTDKNEEKLYLRLFISEAQGFVTYNTKSKVRLDGERLKYDDAYRSLCGGSAEPERQLIKIKLDGDSDISEIDTAYRGTGENDDSMECNANQETFRWSIRTGRLGMGETLSYLLDRYGESVETFVVPQTDDVYNVDNYAKKANLENNGLYVVSIYDSNAFGIPKAAVVYQDVGTDASGFGNGDTDGGGMIVSKINKVVNEDGDVVDNIIGYRLFDGNAVNLYTNDKADASQVKKGSLIDYSLDFKGRIEKVYPAPGIDPENVDYNNTYRLYYGAGDTSGDFLANASRYVGATVIAKKDGSYISVPKSETPIETLDPDNMSLQDSMIYDLGDAKIFLYKNKKVTEIKANELDSYVYSVNPEARVVIMATYSQLKGVVVYDNK